MTLVNSCSKCRAFKAIVDFVWIFKKWNNFCGIGQKYDFSGAKLKKCKEKALQTSWRDSYKSAESISIKFANVDFWLKFMKTARGTPWKTFFAQEMKWLEIYRNDSIWPWQTDPRILRLSNKCFSFYEFSKSEIILVNLARNMIFRVENWKIAGEKALHNSLEDS